MIKLLAFIYGLHGMWFGYTAIRQKLAQKNPHFLYILLILGVVLGESATYIMRETAPWSQLGDLFIPLFTLSLIIRFSSLEVDSSRKSKRQISYKLPFLAVILGFTLIENTPKDLHFLILTSSGVVALMLTLALLWPMLDRFRLIYRNVFYATVSFIIYFVLRYLSYGEPIGYEIIFKWLMMIFLYQSFNIILVNDYLRRTLRKDE